MPRQSLRVGLVLLPLACGVTACDLPPEDLEQRHVYVGKVQGTDVAIGLSAVGSELVFYSGGGQATIATHSRWFVGSSDDDRIDVERDEWVVRGSRDESRASGTMMDPRGKVWIWEAREVGEDASAGLYRAPESAIVGGCRAGVVVLDATLAQGAWCDGQGMFAEVTPMSKPIERIGDGTEAIEVQVTVAGELLQFNAEPIF